MVLSYHLRCFNVHAASHTPLPPPDHEITSSTSRMTLTAAFREKLEKSHPLSYIFEILREQTASFENLSE